MANKVLDTSLIYDCRYEKSEELDTSELFDFCFYVNLADREPNIINHQEPFKWPYTYEELDLLLKTTEGGPCTGMNIYGTEVLCHFTLHLTEKPTNEKAKVMMDYIVKAMLNTGLQPQNLGHSYVTEKQIGNSYNEGYGYSKAECYAIRDKAIAAFRKKYL